MPAIRGPGARVSAAIVWLALLGACATPEVASGIHDPFEARNRQLHEANKAFDNAVLRPVALSYGESVPEPVRAGISSFAGNLSLPGTILNDLLQLNIDDAAHNTVRFLVNSTLGLGGFIDLAGSGGVEERPTDFGETLHVWGASEGAYLEVPFVGPSTERDAVGLVVDFFIDPMNAVLPLDQRVVRFAAGTASTIGDRYRFGSTVDSILYDSADSYVQTRLFYLENRRFELGGRASQSPDDELYDLYEEAYE